MIQILHNPRCGKSRDCLAFIEKSGKEYEIVRYLDDIPTVTALKAILKKLNFKPIELVRTNEQIWIDNFSNKKMTDQEIIDAMISYPILIQRPIVINGDKAFIGRDLGDTSNVL